MSDHFLRASLASLVASLLLQSADARADSFEVVSYTPPCGWAIQSGQDGRACVRPEGIGTITFHASEHLVVRGVTREECNEERGRQVRERRRVAMRWPFPKSMKGGPWLCRSQ